MARNGHRIRHRQCPFLAIKQTSSGRRPRSPFDPGCVKTCTSRECAELFSFFSPFDGDCQSGSFLIQRNRDKLSTRKFGVGVFTQPGPKADLGTLTLMPGQPPSVEAASGSGSFDLTHTNRPDLDYANSSSADRVPPPVEPLRRTPVVALIQNKRGQSNSRITSYLIGRSARAAISNYHGHRRVRRLMAR